MQREFSRRAWLDHVTRDETTMARIAVLFSIPRCVHLSPISAQKHLEKIDDASTELMMGGGDTVLLRLGDAMFEVEEDDATEYCEKEVERQQELLDKLKEEEADILQRQGGLKKALYSRFGKSINLEA